MATHRKPDDRRPDFGAALKLASSLQVQGSQQTEVA